MSGTRTATSRAEPAQASRLARLRMAALGMATMLILEFILGMVDNLYGTAPTPKKHIGLFSSPALALHVILGLLLLLTAAMQLIRAVGARHGLTIWMAAVGLVSIVGAGLAGLGFTGSGASGASLGMSIAFAVALACYIVVIFALAGSSAT